MIISDHLEGKDGQSGGELTQRREPPTLAMPGSVSASSWLERPVFYN